MTQCRHYYCLIILTSETNGFADQVVFAVGYGIGAVTTLVEYLVDIVAMRQLFILLTNRAQGLEDNLHDLFLEVAVTGHTLKMVYSILQRSAGKCRIECDKVGYARFLLLIKGDIGIVVSYSAVDFFLDVSLGV